MSLVSTGQMNESDVFALLKLISDPKASKQRLEELQKLSAVLATREDELRTRASALDQLKVKLTMQAQDLDERGLKLKAANDALNADRAALEQRVDEVERAAAKHIDATKARVAEVESKTAALERARSAAAKQATDDAAALFAREQKVAAREEAVAEREHDVEAAEAAYTRKADRLRKELEA